MDIKYMKLLNRQYQNAAAVRARLIELNAICGMPKGTEYFFSDLHGEHRAFIHMLRSASGIIRAKVSETFGETMSHDAQQRLAELIYYPERELEAYEQDRELSEEWQKRTILDLLSVARIFQSKSSRRKVRSRLPEVYAHVIDEMLHAEGDTKDKDLYYAQMLDAIAGYGAGRDVIIALCHLIQRLSIDTLHIIGDIFDRGARPDLIMDEIMEFPDVDIEWGNHDVSWMGAAAGNRACIATVLRIATSYNCFDLLEDGYGINLRPLSMFAAEVYRDDPCTCFAPHLLDENIYDAVNPGLAAKMCKAISVIAFKLEEAVIRRHPEYGMEERLLLEQVDYENGTVTIRGREYPMRDHHFPTIDPKDPARLSEREEKLMEVLCASFIRSKRLQKHVRFLFSHGSMYHICNGNLLYHGCIPMDEKGHFLRVGIFGRPCYGRELMDEINGRATEAFFSDSADEKERECATDLFWYLWCGARSPLFGKDKMASFENCFVDDPELKREVYNPYYEYSVREEYARKILQEFSLDPDRGHIINGHVPVEVKRGESPVKADGRLFLIDGGMSKAYHEKTGIAGYTLIFNSRHLALAEHMPFREGEEDTPGITIVEELQERARIRDTDEGEAYQREIEDLQELLKAYNRGVEL